MNNTVLEDDQQFFQQGLYSISRLAKRWDVSQVTIRRFINAGDLRSVTIGAKRLVPWDEIRRVEFTGIGKAGKRGPKPKSAQLSVT